MILVTRRATPRPVFRPRTTGPHAVQPAPWRRSPAQAAQLAQNSSDWRRDMDAGPPTCQSGGAKSGPRTRLLCTMGPHAEPASWRRSQRSQAQNCSDSRRDMDAGARDVSKRGRKERAAHAATRHNGPACRAACAVAPQPAQLVRPITIRTGAETWTQPVRCERALCGLSYPTAFRSPRAEARRRRPQQHVTSCHCLAVRVEPL
jgi:hypothetical protein